MLPPLTKIHIYIKLKKVWIFLYSRKIVYIHILRSVFLKKRHVKTYMEPIRSKALEITVYCTHFLKEKMHSLKGKYYHNLAMLAICKTATPKYQKQSIGGPEGWFYSYYTSWNAKQIRKEKTENPASHRRKLFTWKWDVHCDQYHHSCRKGVWTPGTKG